MYIYVLCCTVSLQAPREWIIASALESLSKYYNYNIQLLYIVCTYVG